MSFVETDAVEKLVLRKDEEWIGVSAQLIQHALGDRNLLFELIIVFYSSI